jgi:hypothetical protein
VPQSSICSGPFQEALQSAGYGASVCGASQRSWLSDFKRCEQSQSIIKNPIEEESAVAFAKQGRSTQNIERGKRHTFDTQHP